MSRGGVQVKALAPRYQTWGKEDTKHLIAFAVPSVMYVFSIWARAIRGKQTQAVWKKAHMVYRAIHASAQRGKIPPVSWQMFSVSPQWCFSQQISETLQCFKAKEGGRWFLFGAVHLSLPDKTFSVFSSKRGPKNHFFLPKNQKF